MSRYIKAYVALVGALSTWAISYFPDNADLQRTLGLAAAVGTAALVFQLPNRPPIGEHADPEMSEQDVYREDPNAGPASVEDA